MLKKPNKQKRALTLVFLVAISLVDIFLFNNCSSNTSTNPINNGNGGLGNNIPAKVEVVGEEPYSLIGQNFTAKLLKISKADRQRNIYALFIKGCAEVSCPLVVVSNPYSGLDWSQETVDSKWFAKASGLPSLIDVADEDGPPHPEVSGDATLFFPNNSRADTANMGGLFLMNKVSVLVVLNRFYAGGKISEYPEDFYLATEAVVKSENIDRSRIGFLGLSLGGFVVSQAARVFQPKAIALVSPLIDLQQEVEFVLKGPERIDQNTTLRNRFVKFFNSYLRRIYTTTGGAPNNHDYSAYSINALTNDLKMPTLIIQDTWDVLTPSNLAENFVTMMKQKSRDIQSLWFSHASGIDYNNFAMDHLQPSEGLTNQSSTAFYQIFMLNQLYIDLPLQPIDLYYDALALNLAFAHFKSMSARGESLEFLRPIALLFCDRPMNLLDYSGFGLNVSGKAYIQGVMKNIFSKPYPEAETCLHLKEDSNPF